MSAEEKDREMTEFYRKAAESIYLFGVLTGRLGLDPDTATPKQVERVVVEAMDLKDNLERGRAALEKRRLKLRSALRELVNELKDPESKWTGPCEDLDKYDALLTEEEKL